MISSRKLSPLVEPSGVDVEAELPEAPGADPEALPGREASVELLEAAEAVPAAEEEPAGPTTEVSFMK